MSGAFQFVYVTPEFVANRRDDIAAMHRVRRFGLLAVDEAHCVVDWGRTYRRDFAALDRLRASDGPLPGVPLIAVTATATLTEQARSHT